jgi:hypothetical protein
MTHSPATDASAMVATTQAVSTADSPALVLGGSASPSEDADAADDLGPHRD